jgi:hypothetical protein
VYDLTATFAGTVGLCNTSNDLATLTAATAGDSATGGGWVNLSSGSYCQSGAGRANFGFVINKKPDSNPVEYKGQFVLVNNSRWRLKGDLNSYVKLLNSPTGSSSGTGKLYWWDQTLNAGTGGWVLVGSNVSFTISFTDNGSGKRATPDSISIQIQYSPVPPQDKLPKCGSQVPLSGGDITVH